jgi:hypothetical protein
MKPGITDFPGKEKSGCSGIGGGKKLLRANKKRAASSNETARTAAWAVLQLRNDGHVLCGRTLLALHHLELDDVTLFE